MTTSSPGSEPEDDQPAPPARPSSKQGGTLYVADDDDPEEGPGPGAARGRWVSTVLTALLVAAGLALPGVAAFLLRPEATPPAVTPQAERPRAPVESPAPGTAAPPARGTESPLVDGRKDPVSPRTPVETPAVTADSQEKRARVDRRHTGPVRTASAVLQASDAAQRAGVDEPSLPAEQRAAAALSLLDAHVVRGRWRSLDRDAEHIARLDLPRHAGRLPAEEAAWMRVKALNHLEQWEQLLEAGEDFLRAYPSSLHAPLVDSYVRTTAMVRATHEQRRRDVLTGLEDLEQQTAREVVLLEARGEPTTEVRRKRDFERCRRPALEGLHAETAPACRAYYEAWSPGTTELARFEARDARNSEILALIGLRRHVEARERFAAFQSADPEGARQASAGTRLLGVLPGAEE